PRAADASHRAGTPVHRAGSASHRYWSKLTNRAGLETDRCSIARTASALSRCHGNGGRQREWEGRMICVLRRALRVRRLPPDGAVPEVCEEVASPKQVLRSQLVQNNPRIDTFLHLEGDSTAKIRFDLPRYGVPVRPLRCQDEMNPSRPRLGPELFHAV